MRWLDWGPDAFKLAKKGDKPVLLAITSPYPSICRLMDRETWSDADVAKFAEAEYVCVRVDADRFPDVNERYNCGALPSTVFLTPEGDLLWGATFIPPDDMRVTLARLKAGFETNRAKLAEAIKERDTRVTRAQLGVYDNPPEMSQEILRRTLRGIVGMYDPLFGGFGKAPKFPLAGSLAALLQAFSESGGGEFEGILLKTLDVIGDRGLFDPVEAGFFACSRSEAWTQPETEKLLADQAALIRIYLDAGQIFESPGYLAKGTATIDYVRRRLFDAERGLFLAGQAADPEYYIVDAAARAKRAAPEVPAAAYVDGGALMVSTLLRAAVILPDDDLGASAVKSLQVLLGEGRDPKGGMAHTLVGEPRVAGLLRDQVCVAAALLDAYEWAADDRFYAEAERLLDFTMDRFWDKRDGGLLDRITGRDELGELSKRRRRIGEAALAARSLARLGRHDEAKRVLTSFPDYREDYGHHSAEYAIAVDSLVGATTTITLEFPSSDAALPAMRTAALQLYVPRRNVRHVRGEARRAVVKRGGKETSAATPAELAKLLNE